MRRVLLPCLAAFAVTSCMLKPPTATKPSAIQTEGVVRTGNGIPTDGPVKPGGGIVSDKGSGIISNNGGSIISNNSGTLVGHVSAPSGLISNNGGNLISNNGGTYRVFGAPAETGVAGAEVVLVTADGKPLKGADGKPFTAKTDAKGDYKLPFPGATMHLLARVTLSDNKGELLGFVPRVAKPGADRTVDLNLRSTYTMGYIMGQYVKGDAKILEKLPEDIEAETRTKMGDALAKTNAPAPSSLSTDAVGKAVDSLRGQDGTIDAQMEKVKRILLVGLSEQGVGKSALSVETDAVTLGVNPQGEVFYGGTLTSRVWRKDAQGLLRAYAGNGQRVSLAQALTITPDKPAPGDGAAATSATVTPTAIDFDADGNLYIADPYLKRVRKVDAAGVITTLAAHAEWDTLTGLVVGPDGVVYVSSKLAIYKIAADKTVTKVCGGAAGTPAGGSPDSLKFSGISDLTLDPVKGWLYALDASRVIVEVRPDQVNLLSGAFSGVGGIDFRPDGSLLLADQLQRKVFLLKDWVKTTLAGNGQFGLTGDGGTATASAMCGPRNLAVGGDGAIYVADAGYVRRIKDSTISTVIGRTSEAGTVPIDQAQFREPKSLLFDAASNALIVAELWRVRRWDLAANTMATIVSAGPMGGPYTEGAAPTAASLLAFQGIARDPAGNLVFPCDDAGGGRRVLRLKAGKLETLVGNGTDRTSAGLLSQLGKPALAAAVPAEAMAIAASDTAVYYPIQVANGGVVESVILQAEPGGNVTELCRIPSSAGAAVFGLALTPDGKSLLIGGVGGFARYDFAAKAKTDLVVFNGSSFDDPQAIGLPAGMAFDGKGNVYYADYLVGRVNRMKLDTGVITNVAGKGTSLLNGSRVDDSLTSPWGVALDGAGNLYVAETGANQIKKIPAAQLPN